MVLVVVYVLEDVQHLVKEAAKELVPSSVMVLVSVPVKAHALALVEVTVGTHASHPTIIHFSPVTNLV